MMHFSIKQMYLQRSFILISVHSIVLCVYNTHYFLSKMDVDDYDPYSQVRHAVKKVKFGNRTIYLRVEYSGPDLQYSDLSEAGNYSMIRVETSTLKFIVAWIENYFSVILF